MSPSENKPTFDRFDEDYFRHRTRAIINGMLKWKGPTAHLRMKLLSYLRELGETVSEVEALWTEDEAIDEFFETFRFRGVERVAQYRQVLRPRPPMTITQADEALLARAAAEAPTPTISPPEQVEEGIVWRSFEGLPPAPVRRRLNFDADEQPQPQENEPSWRYQSNLQWCDTCSMLTEAHSHTCL